MNLSKKKKEKKINKKWKEWNKKNRVPSPLPHHFPSNFSIARRDHRDSFRESENIVYYIDPTLGTRKIETLLSRNIDGRRGILEKSIVKG